MIIDDLLPDIAKDVHVSSNDRVGVLTIDHMGALKDATECSRNTNWLLQCLREHVKDLAVVHMTYKKGSPSRSATFQANESRDGLMAPKTLLDDLKYPWAVDFCKDLNLQDGDTTLRKPHYNGFHDTDLVSLLRDRVDILFCTGIDAAYCVPETMEGAVNCMPGVQVVGVLNCIGTDSPQRAKEILPPLRQKPNMQLTKTGCIRYAA